MSPNQNHHHHPQHPLHHGSRLKVAAAARNATKYSSNPPSFICPLTYQIMDQPVNCRCAHTFEREAIVSWLARGNPCCPISRKDLAWEDLVPNHILAERIEKWKWQKEHEDWLQPEKKKQASRGSRTLFSGNQKQAADQDDKNELSEVDLEMQSIHPLPGPKNQIYSASQIYQAVPTGVMLLPQEQAIQDSIRKRKEESRQKRRQALICSTVLGLCLALAVVAAGLYVAHLLQQEKNDELDDGKAV